MKYLSSYRDLKKENIVRETQLLIISFLFMTINDYFLKTS